MEKTFPKEFKKTFLLMFTKELIKHSLKQDIIKLEKIIETKEKQETKPMPVQLIAPSPRQPIQMIGRIPRKIPIKKTRLMPATKQISRPQEALFIPEPKLPEHLAYLKPVPAQSTEIDLWKLNPLIKDPAVRIIEGNPDEKVKVTGTMGTKFTDIILNKEDINRIINRFSEISKIPSTEGVYKVVVGNLVLSAIISEVVGSRFVIKKIAYPARQQYGRIPAQRGTPQQPPIIPQRTPFLGQR